MKICHLGTWKCKCGIAEYLELLAHYLDRAGAEQFVFGNALSEQSRIPHYHSIADRPDRLCSQEVFAPYYLEGAFWGERSHWLEEWLARESPEIVHVQIQTNLYDVAWLNGFLDLAHNQLGIRTVATFHDSGVWPEFAWSNLDGVAAHREDTMAGFPLPAERKRVLPRGIPARPPLLCSFALGRSDHARVREALERRRLLFAVHDPVHGEWLSHDALINWIRAHDGVVLWYPETGASVSSGALRTALAARRRIYVSDTSWFREAESPLIKKFTEFDAMVAQIERDFHDPMIAQNNFENVAERHLDWYAEVIAQPVSQVQWPSGRS